MKNVDKIDLSHIIEPLRPFAVPVSSLTLDPNNANKHDDENLKAIEKSMLRFGQRLPLVVQKTGMVVRAGNGRLMVARSLGWTHIAALVVDDNDVDATLYALADNQTSNLSDWDYGRLSELLAGLDELHIDLDVTGFPDYQRDLLLNSRFAPAKYDTALDEAFTFDADAAQSHLKGTRQGGGSVEVLDLAHHLRLSSETVSVLNRVMRYLRNREGMGMDEAIRTVLIHYLDTVIASSGDEEEEEEEV